MGTWGERLFADDTACDVRDAYREELRRGGAPAAAVRAVLDEFKDEVGDADDGPVVWLALAVTEHKMGHATARVVAAARRVLDRGLGLGRWDGQGPAARRARLREYERIRTLLDSPRPAPAPIKVRKVRVDDSGLRPGEVFRLPIGPEEGSGDRFAYFRVVGLEKERDAVLPVVVLLDYPPPNPEPPADPAGCPRLGIRNIGGIDGNFRFEATMLHGWFRRGSPRKAVEVVGAVRVSNEEAGLKGGRVSAHEWSTIAEAARVSFDRGEWPTAPTMLRRLRAMTPGEISERGGALIREVDRPEGGLLSLLVPARELIENLDYARGAATAEVALEKWPDEPYLHAHLGWARLGLGRTDDAERAWTRAVSLTAAPEQRTRMEERIAWCRSWVERYRGRKRPFSAS